MLLAGEHLRMDVVALLVLVGLAALRILTPLPGRFPGSATRRR